MKIIEVKAKEIFTKTKLGTDYVINPYVGCSHNCLYCYAKFIARWRPVEYGNGGSGQLLALNGRFSGASSRSVEKRPGYLVEAKIGNNR